MFSKLLSLLFVFLSVFCSAQENISVHLQSKDDGAPVELGYVNVYSDTHVLLSTVMTDSNGNAEVSINNYPAEIEVVAFGYDREVRKIFSLPQAVLKFNLTKRFSSINEVVVTGVASPTKPQNALSVYKLISAATIRAQGAVTLNEVLKNQLNMNIRNDNILGAGIRMQGLTGDKIKTLIDGVAVNGREGGNIDMGQINLMNVERIEIVQGPMSIIYGSDALGGVINLIEANFATYIQRSVPHW